jgi:transposase
MGEYIGLDVSLKDTAVSIRRDRKRIWRGKCAFDPQTLAVLIRKHAPAVERVVFETGPLSIWFYHALSAEGLPAICIDARHAKAALDMAPNKTDANEADGLAHQAEIGFYRVVRVKGFDSMLTRTLVAARGQLRKVTRSQHEGARDLARAIATTDAYLVSHRQRKKVEMLFAHLKRILKPYRLRLRGPYSAKDEFPPRSRCPKPA